MGRPVVHWELWSEDPDEDRDVLSAGVRLEDSAHSRPQVSRRRDRRRRDQRGHHEAPERPWPAKLAFYIDVDDLEEYGEKIKRAGGKIVVERMDVPGVGQLSLFEDPEGRVLGMWKQEESLLKA